MMSASNPACSAMASAAAAADQASVRGERLAKNSATRSPKLDDCGCRRDLGAGKASILANSVFTSRPDGSPAASLTWVSCSSSARTHS